MTVDLAAIAQAGVEALRVGKAEEARAAFVEVEQAGRGTHQLRLLLARACIMLGDDAQAHRALDAVLQDEPANLYALILRGDVLGAAGDRRAAVSWYQAALAHAPRAGPLSAELTEMLRRTANLVAESGAAFEAHLDKQLSAAGVDVSAAGLRFAEALEILVGRMPVQLQQPTSFHYPGLQQRPFFERNEFDWVAGLETEAPRILAELQAVLEDEAVLTPYVTPEEDRPAKRHALLNDPRWSAFHLFRDGLPIAKNADRCPATMAALERLPIPRIAGRAPMALFSVLRPGTHIPPHHGMLNTRLICHLPLIVPNGCRLRVGNETRSVERGRTMIFDDSIEHEAWNDGDTTRVVLLFEIWRPDINAVEQSALTALYEAISAYAPMNENAAGA